VCAAAAEIFIHSRDHLFAGGIGIPVQKVVGREDHAWCTEAALQGIVCDEGLLQGMQVAVFCETFDCDDFFAIDCADTHGAGAYGAMIHENSTGAAFADAAAEFWSSGNEVRAKNPEERALGLDFNLYRLAIQPERDCLLHSELGQERGLFPAMTAETRRGG